MRLLKITGASVHIVHLTSYFFWILAHKMKFLIKLCEEVLNLVNCPSKNIKMAHTYHQISKPRQFIRRARKGNKSTFPSNYSGLKWDTRVQRHDDAFNNIPPADITLTRYTTLIHTTASTSYHPPTMRKHIGGKKDPTPA
jgi:hypothetical protein